MTWTDFIKNKGLETAEYLQKGFHAMPAKEGGKFSERLPSMHRLWNAGFMFGAFIAGAWMRDILRGFKENGEIIEKEDVPHGLRWLHGTLHHNPYSDAAEDQWKKVFCQLIPATVAAAGAIGGSIYFFRKNGTEQKYYDAMKQDKLGILTADKAMAYSQSLPLRIMAGLFATFSSASGLTLVYGFFLNAAFGLSSNRKMWGGAAELTGINGFRHPTHTTANDFRGAPDMLSGLLKESKRSLNRLKKLAGGHLENITPEQWKQETATLHEGLFKGVIEPLLPKLSADRKKQLREELDQLIDQTWKQAVKEGKTPDGTLKLTQDQLLRSAEQNFAELFADIRPNAEKKVADYAVDSGNRLVQTLMKKRTDTDAFGLEHPLSKEELMQAVPGNNGWYSAMANCLRKMTGDKTSANIMSKWHKQLHEMTAPAAGLGR